MAEDEELSRVGGEGEWDRVRVKGLGEQGDVSAGGEMSCEGLPRWKLSCLGLVFWRFLDS